MAVTLAALALAMLQQVGQSATVPMREEPYHQLVFENPHVAVYNVVLPVGAVMRYHEHPTNHLAIVIDSGRMRNEVVGRTAKINPSGAPGTIVYLPAGPPHRQANIGQTTVRFIAIEVLSPLPGRGRPSARAGGKEQRADPDDRPGCRVAFEAADVRAWRCRLGPGESAPRRPRGNAFLRVAVSDGRLEQPSGMPQVKDLSAGAAVWHETIVVDAPTNAGTSVLELVDLEWK
jgi:quercetin dioxygenase-like cupin family protein